jgi:carbon monoxide dehydrogenase subunit G
MTKIESEKTEINKPVAEVYNFLCDMRNYEKLMPEQITNWQATENDCTFTISGMATISMGITEKNPNRSIKIVSQGKVPFNFDLNVLIEEKGPALTGAEIIMNADLNMMLKMMAQKPLTNFINMLAQKMKEI